MKYFNLLFIFLFTYCIVSAQLKPVFQVVPLGVKGGLDESNLSAYMLASIKSNDYICLDAGTLYAGISKAIDNKIFHNSAVDVLKKISKRILFLMRTSIMWQV